MATPPPVETLLVTVTVAGRYPSSVNVAMNSDLRGILIEHGVAWQWKPLEVSTRAPGGVDVTSQAVLVPRVTEAQADVSDVATPSAARMAIFFIIQDAPR